MKNLLFLMLVSFCASCDLETEKLYSVPASLDEEPFMQRASSDSIANKSNPYDYCGQLFLEMVETYYETPRSAVHLDTLISEIEHIAHRIPVFGTVKPVAYQPPFAARVQYFVTNKDVCLSPILLDAALSAPAVLSLSTFVHDYLAVCEVASDYSAIYNFVVQYEDSIMSATHLSARDKKTILITTSVARHSAVAKRKRPKKNTDPAWDFLICGIYGSIEGASLSSAEAVTWAVVSAIAENQ